MWGVTEVLVSYTLLMANIGILAAEISCAKPAVAIESVMFNFVSSPVAGRNMFAPQRDLPCFTEECFGFICVE